MNLVATYTLAFIYIISYNANLLEAVSACNIDYCTECTKAVVKPETCKDYYDLDSAENCYACKEHCKRCDTDRNPGQYCIQCDSNYEPAPFGSCERCYDLNCDICKEIGCVKCKDGYVVDDRYHCKECPIDNCRECEQTSNNYHCTKCNTGYSLNGKTCVQACGPSCILCELKSGYHCLECVPAHYVDTSGSCQACPEACDVCNSTALCEKCKTGYYWNGKACTSCELDERVATCTVVTPAVCIECEEPYSPGDSGCTLDENSKCYTCTSDCSFEATEQQETHCSSAGSCWSKKTMILSANGTKATKVSYWCGSKPCDFPDQLECLYDPGIPNTIECTRCCQENKCNRLPPAAIDINQSELERLVALDLPTDVWQSVTSGAVGRLHHAVSPLDFAMEIIDILIVWLVMLLLTRRKW